MRSIYPILILIGIFYNGEVCSQNFKYDRVGGFKEGLAPVYIGKLLGYVDKTGKEVIPVIYEDDYLTDEFTDGVSIVKKNGLSGVIDKTGKLVAPYIYKRLGSFSEGIAEAENADGKVGFIDTRGKTVIPFQYSILTLRGGVKCVNGIIPVTNQSGKSGYIDKTGKLIVPFNYEEITNFSDGIGKVKTKFNGKVSYVNTKGEFVIPEKYDDGTIFMNGIAFVNRGARAKSLYSELTGGKWGAIDKTGKEIIPVTYDRIYETKNGFTIVANGKYPDEKKGLMGRDGKLILPVEYHDIKILKDRLVASKVYVGPYALFDYTGKQLCDFKWHLFDIFPEITDGLLRVQELKNNTLGKVGAIDINGILKIPFLYDGMNEFSEGLAGVSLNKKYGVIDNTGKTIVPFKYTYIGVFSEGWAAVMQNGKYGFINKSGTLMDFSKSAATSVANNKPAAEEKYQLKEKLLDFFVVVNGAVPSGNAGESTGGKFGILSKDEKMLIPQKYDWISLDSSLRAFFVQTGVNVFFSTKGTRIDTTVNTRIGILGYDGKQLYPASISAYRVTANKHIIIKDAGTRKWGILNAGFKIAVPAIYEQVYTFTDSGVAAKKNGKIGIINLKNEILVPFDYDSVFAGGKQAPGGYQLKKTGSAILVNAKGEIIPGGPEPYETKFQKALSLARNSQERCEALMNFLNPVYVVSDSASFAKLVKQKFDQVAAIDFYAIHMLILTNKDVNQFKISRFIMNILSPQQRTVIKKYSQCIIDNFTRSQNNLPELPCPPADTPQPGQPWKNN
ncbi:MAG: WG repeat-containing protein [Lacibacter sp.]